MLKDRGFYKGVNLGGWLSQCRLEKEHLENFITESDLKRIGEFGLDHVRLPIDYPLIETDDGTPLWEGYDYIDRCADWCEKYGLGLILDLHKTAGHDFSQAGGRTAFFESKDLQERFFSLWERLAKRYGSHNKIAFDLLNEVVDPAVIYSAHQYPVVWGILSDTGNGLRGNPIPVLTYSRIHHFV